MKEKIDFNIEDLAQDEIICNIDIEELDISSIPLIEGDSHE